MSQKEKSIIFNGEMVRAILDGRKAQTRRVVKGNPLALLLNGDRETMTYEDCYGDSRPIEELCPYGQKGDCLWVRETWVKIFNTWPIEENNFHIEYKADSNAKYPGEWPAEEGGDPECPKWRPSIHMPRWASRITLEIVDIRVERLQDISEKDAKAEGVAPLFDEKTQRERPECRSDYYLNYLWHGNFACGLGNKKSDAWPYQYSGYEKARDSFSSLWEMIHGPGSWKSNPWVWAIEFKRIKP